MELRKNRWKMYLICLILGFLCLAYYCACALYAGVGSSFIFRWLIGTVFFFFTGGMMYVSGKEIITIPTFLAKGYGILVLLGFLLFFVVEGMIITHMMKEPEEDCDYLLVLGCQIRGDHITKSLRKRLDTAYDYAIDHSDVRIIVSGGQGDGEFTTEALAMKEYLKGRGISEDRIQMEDESTDTNENMRYSVRYIEDREKKVGIVTSNFHIFRAKMLARANGMNNICGIASPSDPVLFVNYMVRESIGVIKDFVFGNFRR